MKKVLFCQSCFGNLAVKTRMQIFLLLRKHGRMNVSEVVACMQLRQPTISYHLKQMTDAQLLSKERQGKSMYYTVASHCPNKNHACVLKQASFALA